MTSPTSIGQSDLLRGSATKGLARLAWPVIASYLAQYCFEMVDLYWVGTLPNAEIPLAALTVCVFISWLLNSLIQIVVVGTTTLVAQSIGAGRREHATRYGRETLSFGLLFGAVVALTGLLTMRPLLELLELEPVVIEAALPYLTVLYVGTWLTYWMMAFDSILRGAGDALTPLRIGLMAFALNAVLDPLLIFGVGPFEGLGLLGAASASVTARLVAVGIYLYRARRGSLRLPLLKPIRARFTTRVIAACARIGLPIGALGIVFMMVHFALVKVIHPYGSEAVTALGIGSRVEGLTWVMVDALGVATQTMVGQNLGAGQTRRAMRTVWVAMFMASAIASVVAAVLIVADYPIARLFASSASQAAIDQTAHYIRINAACQIFMAWELVMTGAFAGVGYTLPPLIASTSINLCRVPLALGFAAWFSMGAESVYWTIAVTCIVRGLLMVVWFWFGRWRRERLELV